MLSFARNEGGEVSMNGTAARHEADKILAELPDRISDVIKPFVRQTPDHPALVRGDVTWTYAELAAVVADTALILQHYDIRPGDRVMIVSENCLALAALIFAASEIDAWSVVVNPLDREAEERPLPRPGAAVGARGRRHPRAQRCSPRLLCG